jgi:hypothetical protein
MVRRAFWRLAYAGLLCCVQATALRADDGRTFPDQNDPAPAAHGDNVDAKKLEVDPQLLKKRFGGKAKWDADRGVLALEYDFRRGQEKDWEVDENCISRPAALRGIRVAAATKLVHKAIFVEGSCAFQYAIRQPDDKGILLTAGNVEVRQHYFNDRCFFLNNREANIGNENDALKLFNVHLMCQPTRCSLKVSRSEVAFARGGAEPFRFALHGGENGGEFGSLSIYGKPHSDWFAEFLK